jgi:thioredoxin reductase (NADPH)
MENVVIMGSGPAGLTAAVYCARAALAPVVVDGMQPGGQLTQTTEVENFPGFEHGIDGNTLVDTMRRQAERFGCRFVTDEVSSVVPGAPHRVVLSSGETLAARAIIVATGASARYLGLPSEQAFVGRGVSACATCDGAFFRNQDVAVVGGGDTAMEDSLYLARLCRSVTVIHRRDAFRASHVMADRTLTNPKIKVRWNSVVEDVLGNASGVTGLRLKDTKTGVLSELEVTGLFVAIGHDPNTAPLKSVLALDAEGFIVADARCRTSVPGIFAAGDVADRYYKQAVTAAGTGCAAALEAERYISGH